MFVGTSGTETTKCLLEQVQWSETARIRGHKVFVGTSTVGVRLHVSGDTTCLLEQVQWE